MAFKYQKYAVAFVLALGTLSPSVVSAAGFSSSGSPARAVTAKAFATNYARASSRSGRISTKNFAKVGQYTINGDVLRGYAEAGNKVKVYIDGKPCNNCKSGNVHVDQKSVAKTKIHIKGKNMLAKAYARNTLKIKVDGKLFFENEEYAYAMGRFTPIGTQMRAGASSHNKLQAKGLVRLKTGQIVRVTGQVKR